MIRLRIKNCGPITEGFDSADGFMSFGTYTLFVGDQGTGKSTVAKLLSIFSWLEKALFRGDDDSESFGASDFRGLYKNQLLSDSFSKDTEIEYIGDAYKFFYKMQGAKKRVAVIYYDLDRLKYLNDNYGHEMGDMAIKTVAHLIRKYASDDVMGFRLGGDEFLVLDTYESEDVLKERISKIEEELKKVSKNDNYPIELSVSVGYVVTDPDSDEELDNYVNQADDVMYKAKVARKMNRRD